MVEASSEKDLAQSDFSSSKEAPVPCWGACLWAAGSVAGVIVTGSLYFCEREMSAISTDNTCRTAVTVPGG